MKIKNPFIFQMLLILVFTPFVVAYENLIQNTFSMENLTVIVISKILLILAYIGIWVWLIYSLYTRIKYRIHQYTLIKKDVLDTIIASNETLMEYSNTEIRYLKEDIEEYFKKIQAQIQLKDKEGKELNSDTILHDLGLKSKYTTNDSRVRMNRINERLGILRDKNFESMRKHIDSESTLNIISPAKLR